MAVSMANSVAITIAYARLGTAKSFGTYQLGIAAIATVAPLGLAGAAAAVTRGAAQGRSPAWPLFRYRFALCLAAGAALAVVGLAFALADRSSVAATLFVAGLMVPLFQGGDVYQAHLLGAREYARYFRFYATVQISTAAGVIAAVAALPDKPWLALLALTALTGAFQLRGLLSLRRAAVSSDADVRFAKRMTWITVLGAVDARLDILVVGALIGVKDVALVAVAQTLPTGLKRLWAAVIQPAFVRMSAEHATAARDVLRRNRGPALAGSVIVAAVGLVVAPAVIRTVFGSAYEESTTLAQLLFVAAAISSVGSLHETLLRAQDRLGRVAVIYVVLPLLSFISLPLLVGWLGIEGVGVEAIGVAIVYAAVATYFAEQDPKGPATT
jgi:O-antigen/teichoic acid export membrane protein